MKQYYIYKYTGKDDNGTFTELHYYRQPVEKDTLEYVGECVVEDSFFSATACKYYDEKGIYISIEGYLLSAHAVNKEGVTLFADDATCSAYESRSKCEEAAFTKAFEILDNKTPLDIV